jgi:hypothetical protein
MASNWLRVFRSQALLVLAKGEGNGSRREWCGQKNVEDSGAQSDTKCRGSQGFFGLGALAALLARRAALSPYFKKLARFAKLATSYINARQACL